MAARLSLLLEIKTMTCNSLFGITEVGLHLPFNFWCYCRGCLLSNEIQQKKISFNNNFIIRRIITFMAKQEKWWLPFLYGRLPFLRDRNANWQGRHAIMKYGRIGVSNRHYRCLCDTSSQHLLKGAVVQRTMLDDFARKKQHRHRWITTNYNYKQQLERHHPQPLPQTRCHGEMSKTKYAKFSKSWRRYAAHI